MTIKNRASVVTCLIADLLMVLLFELCLQIVRMVFDFEPNSQRDLAIDAISLAVQLYYGLSILITVLGMWLSKVSKLRYVMASFICLLLWSALFILDFNPFASPEFIEVTLGSTAFIFIFSIQQFLRDKLRKNEYLKEVLSELVE